MQVFTSLDRYIARLMFVPFVGTVVVSAMLLVLDRLGRLLNFVASEGGSVSLVWRMIGNVLPEYISLGVMVGLTLGTALCFRRLAISSELDVLFGVGVSIRRMLRVPYIYAVVLAAFNLVVIGYVQPISRFSYDKLRYELRTGALGASIRVGEFNQLGKKLMLRVEKSHKDGRVLSGVFIKADGPRGRSFVASADQGRFFGTDDRDAVILQLQSGTLIDTLPGQPVSRVLTFAQHSMVIPLPATPDFRGRGHEDPRELTLGELLQRAGGGAATADRIAVLAELYFRLAQIGAMFVLPLLAIAFGIPPKRSSSAVGVFVLLISIVSYYKVIDYAADAAALGKIDPLVALGLPLGLFALLSFRAYYVISHKVGGDPLSAISRLTKSITRLMRRKRAAA